MGLKFSTLIFVFVILMMTSCYTITHPAPCPGLVDVELKPEHETSVSLFN